MKNKNYLVTMITGALVLSLFARCAKGPNEKPVASTAENSTEAVATESVAAVKATLTVKSAEWVIDGAKIAPGSVIAIPAGQRGAILLTNIKGTAAAPITIINSGGVVNITTTKSASYAFKTQNCQYFKILGSGTAGVTYGFKINGANIGMTMDALSSDFEIANVEVLNSDFAGIMAKTDPTCDPATWRGHFTMKNVSIHNNYVHNTGGEGLYIGNSFYTDGVSTSCGIVKPHDVVNAKIYKNYVVATGAEGIQVGSATSGCEIYSNIVRNPGVSPFSAFQNNGIQIGEGTGGKCYNNLITGAPGNGIILLGLGDNVLYNNIIINSKGFGIFADSRYTPGPNFKFVNNTLVGSALGGIKLNSETIPMNTVVNNVLIQSASVGSIIRKSTSVKLTAAYNYVSTDVNSCRFIGYSAENFHLQTSSPLINKGANAPSYGALIDYYGKVRPSGGASDVGAIQH